MFALILSIAEILHTIAHFVVLLGLCKVCPSDTFRRIYFTSDLVTVLLSHYIINKNGILVWIHMIIHLGAILHLFGMKSQIYTNIFKLGEQKWNGQSYPMRIFYIIGTFEDILTHCVNAYYLYYMP